MDDVVLSYHDSLLRKSDLKVLEEGNWLNDNIIGFMFEFFQNELFVQLKNDVVFLDPSLVQLLKLSSDCTPILSSLELGTKLLVFFPLNNNDSRIQAGGSHWSLLVYVASSKCFRHYDSMGGSNYDIARAVTNAIAESFPGCDPTPEETPAPQQTNCYDCGVYLIKISERICQSHLRGDEWNGLDLDPSAITKERHRIIKLILDKTTAT